jgi:2-dehydropantoate 2-reductase
MKIAVYGAGGVGGYFAGRLALAGADVHLIARGPHLDALRARGLRVRSVRGDFETHLPATDDPAAIGPCDFVLFCVKSFDTDVAAVRLHPLIRGETAVITLQNGIDNEDKLAREIGPEHVVGGAAYIFSTIEEPGVIAHTGGPASIVFGELDGSTSRRAKALLALCLKAEIDATTSSEIQVVLWTKFAQICALASVTSTVRLPVGDIRSVPESWRTYREILQEVRDVGIAEGVPLPPNFVDGLLAFAEQVDPGGYSSLHFDMTHGRRMELEGLHGTLVRLARKHGIPVPRCETIYSILKPREAPNEVSVSTAT